MAKIDNGVVMYTDAMRRAFRSIAPPPNFTVELVDNEHFLTLRADAKQFINMYHDQKIEAAEYLIRVKKALESEGALVMLVRTALEEDSK